MYCNYCNKPIIETPTQWAFWYFHHKCYLLRTKYLQDFIDSINILSAMKWFEIKKLRKKTILTKCLFGDLK